MSETITMKEFACEIAVMARERYPECIVDIQEVCKNNGLTLTGISIRERTEAIAPTIYLESYLKEYQDLPFASIEMMFEKIINDYEAKRRKITFPVEELMDFSKVKDRICIRLVNLEKNIHDDVRRICVDETAYRKGYKYITVVYDMDRNRVIWIHEGHGYDVFAEFCRLLTPEEQEKIEIVAGDGASWIDSCKKEFFPNATRCIDFFHVAQWINKALDEVRIRTAAKARREYNNLRDEYIKAEAEAVVAAEKAKQDYHDALGEVAAMPHRGRPSARKLELISFIAEYEAAQAQALENNQPRSVGRPKKIQLTPEHEASLKELSDTI